MSYLDALLTFTNRQDVRWTTLGDVCLSVTSGGTPLSTRSDYYGGDIPWLRTQEVRFTDIHDTEMRITEKGLRESSAKWIPANCVIIAISGATAARSAINKIPLTTNQHCCNLEINPTQALYRYVFYWVSNQYEQIKAQGQGARSDINSGIIKNIPIAVPPVEVQREIVQVLDAFTALEAELEAELEARRRQYSYYRDRLLAFNGRADIRWATLGEVGEFIRGRRFTKADYVDEGVGVIHYGEIYTHYGTSANEVISHVRPDLASQLRFAQPGDVIVTDVGETVEDVGKPVAWLGTEKVAIHDHCYAFRHSMNPKFVSYCMQTTSFIAEKAKYVARTKVNTLLMKGFAKVRIPIPPLEEQARIVAILDKFDALVNDLTSGLPAEINGRRQQYEHYRNRLLTFPEAER